jgi:hypothetical protein
MVPVQLWPSKIPPPPFFWVELPVMMLFTMVGEHELRYSIPPPQRPAELSVMILFSILGEELAWQNSHDYLHCVNDQRVIDSKISSLDITSGGSLV